MSRLKRSSLVLAGLVVAGFALAAPAPKPTITPISATNAHQVRQLQQLERRIDKILRGSKPGELIFLDFDRSAEVVDDVKFARLRDLAKGSRPTDIALSCDGKWLAWTERNKHNYTIQTAAGDKSFDIKLGETIGFATFSPDGKTIAIGYSYWDPAAHGAGYSEMRLFDSSGKHLKTLERTGPGAMTPVYSPDGKILTVGNRNRETLLFDAATGKLLHKLDKRMTHEIAFSPDGKTLATAYVDGTVAVWDVATGNMLQAEPTGSFETYSMDWSPKGDVLATAGHGGKIVLWEPTKLKKLRELDAPAWVIQVRFTADGSRLLTSGASDDTATRERKITVWGLPKGSDR